MKSSAIDEEQLSQPFDASLRRERGIYYTPAPLVQTVLEAACRQLPPEGRLAVVDPSCGAGAFLSACAQRLPHAQLFGLELTQPGIEACRERVPWARLRQGDALRGGLEPLLAEIPSGAFELWVGNPPYNGTSALLKDKQRYAQAKELLPKSQRLPKGTSLRDDFAFFLLAAARRLQGRAGALAFVTSATLLDAFLYAPLRKMLLEELRLKEVIELGPGAFEGTRVRTCVTLWTSTGPKGGAHYRSREAGGPFSPEQLSPSQPFTPRAPEWLLRPPSSGAEALDEAWRSSGEPLGQLVPVSLPGLKTRFDELLVDEDPGRLLERLSAFWQVSPEGLEAFAQAHRIPARCLGKLRALLECRPNTAAPDPAAVRPFFRYAGARHRMRIPPHARAYCYLDRRLIPRGDHRLRGPYDPHAYPVKLVFNTRELPLAAALLDEEGCVNAHRHSRFAPLLVPEVLREHGLGCARAGAKLGPLVPNLSPRGLAYAKRLGGPRELFEAIAAFVNSSAVQQVWAPSFGASRELWVPLSAELLC